MARAVEFYAFVERHAGPKAKRTDVEYYRAVYAVMATRSLVYANDPWAPNGNWNGRSPLRPEHRRWLERAGTAGDYTWCFHGKGRFLLMFSDPNTAFAFRMRCPHTTLYMERPNTSADET